ncbi:hypothetical protein D3C76_1706620 [compost metagenome]
MPIRHRAVDMKGYESDFIFPQVNPQFSMNQLDSIFRQFIFDRIDLLRFIQERIVESDILFSSLDGKSEVIRERDMYMFIQFSLCLT